MQPGTQRRAAAELLGQEQIKDAVTVGLEQLARRFITIGPVVRQGRLEPQLAALVSGMPTETQYSLRRTDGIQGLIGLPVHAARVIRRTVKTDGLECARKPQ